MKAQDKMLVRNQQNQAKQQNRTKAPNRTNKTPTKINPSLCNILAVWNKTLIAAN